MDITKLYVLSGLESLASGRMIAWYKYLHITDHSLGMQKSPRTKFCNQYTSVINLFEFIPQKIIDFLTAEFCVISEDKPWMSNVETLEIINGLHPKRLRQEYQVNLLTSTDLE